MYMADTRGKGGGLNITQVECPIFVSDHDQCLAVNDHTNPYNTQLMVLH